MQESNIEMEVLTLSELKSNGTLSLFAKHGAPWFKIVTNLLCIICTLSAYYK